MGIIILVFLGLNQAGVKKAHLITVGSINPLQMSHQSLEQ